MRSDEPEPEPDAYAYGITVSAVGMADTADVDAVKRRVQLALREAGFSAVTWHRCDQAAVRDQPGSGRRTGPPPRGDDEETDGME